MNLNAGSSLLSLHQSRWEKLHKNTEENVLLADRISQDIDRIAAKSSRFMNAITDFLNQCEKVTAMHDSFQILSNDLRNIEKTISKVENVLDELYLRKELTDFVKFQAEENYKFSQYKEAKATEFEALRQELVADHAKKMKEFEKIELQRLREKQKIYQDAFEKEINLYKLFGRVVRTNDADDSDSEGKSGDKTSNQLVTPLEDIEVEADEEDKKALDSFLQSVGEPWLPLCHSFHPNRTIFFYWNIFI